MKGYYRLWLFVLLLVSMLILLVPWRKEAFGQRNLSTIDLYHRTTTHNEFMNRYERTRREKIFEDNDRLLHMRGCYQFENSTDPKKPNIVQQLIQASSNATHDIKVDRLGPITTNDFNDIEDAIRKNVQQTSIVLRNQTKNPNALLDGEIYVMVLQAPYYKSTDGSMMTVQFNIDDYAYLPVNIANGSAAMKQPLHFEVFVIYANYKKNVQPRSIPFAMDEGLMPFRTNHEQCKIKCAGNLNLICGCATGTKETQGYASKCLTSRLGASSTTDKNKPIPHDFPIVYVVNRQNKNVMNFMSQKHPKRG